MTWSVAQTPDDYRGEPLCGDSSGCEVPTVAARYRQSGAATELALQLAFQLAPSACRIRRNLHVRALVKRWKPHRLLLSDTPGYPDIHRSLIWQVAHRPSDRRNRHRRPRTNAWDWGVALSTSHDSGCRHPREALTRAWTSMSARTGGTRRHSATGGRGSPPTPVASAFVPGSGRAAHGVLPFGTELLSEAVDIRRGQRLPSRPRSAALRHRQSQTCHGATVRQRRREGGAEQEGFPAHNR